MGWLLLDVAWLVAFAALGRVNHSGGLTTLGVADVAWPFLAGYVVAVIVTGLRGSPRSLARGVPAWLITVGIAMAIRTVREGALPPLSFVLVALTFTAVGLLGWRVLVAAVGRRRRAAAEPVG